MQALEGVVSKCMTALVMLYLISAAVPSNKCMFPSCLRFGLEHTTSGVTSSHSHRVPIYSAYNRIKQGT
jgi:hypothetical protein